MKIIPIPPCSPNLEFIALKNQIEEEMINLCGIPGSLLKPQKTKTARELKLNLDIPE